MKRSEMVNNLHEFLWNNIHNLDASDVLQFLEEAGMEPPSKGTGRYNQTHTRTEYYPGGSQNIYDYSEIKENKWENED